MEPALGRRRQADHRSSRHPHRQAAGQGLADARRPRAAVSARLRRRGNSPEDRELTSRLYGGDDRTRIRQELVLGVGGVKALRALGHHARRLSPERRPQRVCPARSDPRADARRRHERSTTPCAKSRSTPSSPRTRPCPPATTASTGGLIEEHLGPAARPAGHLATSN